MLNRYFISFVFVVAAWSAFGQDVRNDVSKIAITIDDVPNTRKFQKDNYNAHLLRHMDSLDIPVAIFINEGLIYRTDSTSKNMELLEEWIKRDYVTAGNHTFSHIRYSDVGFETFKKDVEIGQELSVSLAFKYNKSLIDFRFPYNDLGGDSLDHRRMDSLLQAMNYTISPFTVESSDWMFNAVYEHYLSNSEFERATKIGELYVSKTMDYIHFFDSLSVQVYGRKMNQIYLCHDNAINANYLSEIIGSLTEQGFEFISLKSALLDPAYQQTSKYYKKWGISWLYRWIDDPVERKYWMSLEPDNSEIENQFNSLP